jgi:hypothetical protein
VIRLLTNQLCISQLIINRFNHRTTETPFDNVDEPSSTLVKLFKPRCSSTSKSTVVTKVALFWVYSARHPKPLKISELSAQVKREPERAESLCTTRAVLSTVSVSLSVALSLIVSLCCLCTTVFDRCLKNSHFRCDCSIAILMLMQFLLLLYAQNSPELHDPRW